jgi:hypothetical protein
VYCFGGGGAVWGGVCVGLGGVGEIFQTSSDGLPQAHLASCNNVAEVKRTGLDADHPPSSSVGMEYGSSFTFTFPPCLLEMLKDSPHFFFLQELNFKS